MSTYKEITYDEFKEFVDKELNGVFEELNKKHPSWERVWEYPINDSISIRLFSSIVLEGSRDVGKDAIRVVVWSRHADKMLGGSTRVNRTEGALLRMRDRARELFLKWKSIDTKCDRCNEGHMVERKSRKSRDIFYGCSNFPTCKNTKSTLS